jgi:hypothetical protein
MKNKKREVAIWFLVVLGVTIGFLIKNVKIGLILGLIIGLLAGSLAGRR